MVPALPLRHEMPGAPSPDACTLVAPLRAFADRSTVAGVEERYRGGGIGYGEEHAPAARRPDARAHDGGDGALVLGAAAEAAAPGPSQRRWMDAV